MNMISNVGSAIYTRGSRFCADTGVVAKNIGHAFAGRSWRDISMLFGQLDKVSKTLVSGLNLFPIAVKVSGFVTDNSGIKSTLKPVTETMGFVKDLTYSLLWIGDIPRWMEKDASGKVKFAPPTSKVDTAFYKKDGIMWDVLLYTIGNILDAATFVHTYVRPTEFFTNAAKTIGNTKIFGTAVYNIPVVSSITFNCKDIFIFSACAYRLTPLLTYGYLALKPGADTPKEAKLRDELLQVESLLKIGCAVGKMAIIWTASIGLYKAEWFPLLTLVSDSGSLLNGVLKGRKEVIRATAAA